MSEVADELRRRAQRIRDEQAGREVPGIAGELRVLSARSDLADAKIAGLWEVMSETVESAGMSPRPSRHLRVVRDGEVG